MVIMSNEERREELDKVGKYLENIKNGVKNDAPIEDVQKAFGNLVKDYNNALRKIYELTGENYLGEDMFK